MPMNAGDAATPLPAGGMAREIYEALDTALDAEFGGDYDSSAAEPNLIPLCNAIAAGVVNHLINNMDLNLDGHTGADPFTQAAPGAVS